MKHRHVHRTLWLAITMLAATPVAAQQREPARERTSSQFEMEVERLAQELIKKYRVTLALSHQMQNLQVALREGSIQQQQRAQVETRLRKVRTQLASLEADGARLRRQLQALCPSDARPDGWVGVAYRTEAEWSRDDEGQIVTRFLDFPRVESVDPGSPAERAGIRGGDIIISIAGHDVRDRAFTISSLLKPGTRLPFRIRREGDLKLLTVRVEPRPDDFETQCGWIDEQVAAAFAPPPAPSAPGAPPAPDAPRVPSPVSITRPPPPSGPVAPTPRVAPTPSLTPFGGYSMSATVIFAGAQITAVEGDLAETLGVDRGLLVITAGRGSPAERSGLKGGDVIVAADGRPITAAAHFRQAVDRAEHRSLRLQVIRKGKPMTLDLRW